MIGVYIDDIALIAKQQSDNYKSEIIEFGGSFSQTSSGGNSGLQFSEEIEASDKVEEEVVEEVYKEIKCSIWNFVKFGLFAAIFSFILTFICLSKGQIEPFLDTLKKGLNKVLIPVITVLITVGITASYCIYMINHIGKINKEGEKQIQETAKIRFDGVYKIEGGKSKKYNGTYKSIVSDQSVFIVGDNSSIEINEAIVDKSGVDCFDNTYSKNYGMNSAILAIENGSVDIKSTNIYSDSNGGTTLFAKGKGAYISAKNTKMVALGNAACYGAAASYNGKVDLSQVDLTTNGYECAVLMAGRKSGEINVKDAYLKTYGKCAPLMHARGNILLEKSSGESKESYIGVIEDGGSVQINESNFMAGMKGYTKDEDDAFFVLKSESSDYEDRKPAIITINESVLDGRYDSEVYATAPAFVVSNTEANINLKNNEFKFGSKVLFDIKAIRGLGRHGENGGHANIVTDSQKLVGFVKVDEDSTLKLNMTNGTGFVGGINYLNSGSEKVELSIDATSRMVLTTHCFLTKFENEDASNSNINFGRYKIFVNGKAIN
jgi:hypothetical protein